jgi:tripeptide aminopeptidase
MGLPCPNLCTGGENFHSRFEFISCEVMEKISDILVKIIENAAKN